MIIVIRLALAFSLSLGECIHPGSDVCVCAITITITTLREGTPPSLSLLAGLLRSPERTNMGTRTLCSAAIGPRREGSTPECVMHTMHALLEPSLSKMKVGSETHTIGCSHANQL